MNERELDVELRKLAKPYLKLSSVLEYLINDEGINALLNKANDNMIGRLGYTDHGRVHAKVVSLNALKILSIISKITKPTVIKDRDGNLEDGMVAVLVSAWLHDIGCGVTRDDHELVGLMKAQIIINKILEGVYHSRDLIARLTTFIEEGILCHLGTYKSTSVEAGVVCIADGTDITKGRARLSYMLGSRDIHDFSAMSIESVDIKKGRKQAEIHVRMNSPAGMFQVEKTLLKKIKSTRLDKYVKVVVQIKGDKNKLEY